MGIYKVQDDGKAQKGLKAGDQVVTGGGTYKITGVNADGSYKSEKVNDITTKTYTGNYANQGSSGNSQYTQGNYSIGSEYGKRQAQEMGVNAEWIATDGSQWVKENDGTITVYHGGTKTNNAWVPSNSSERWEEDYMKENPKPAIPQKDPRIDRLLNEILNRDDFSYDVMNDPLYQQYAKMYQREGDRAMRETLAEAAAGAGGMNTYAITAAQQANNYYNSQLNDRIPELYQLAYDMYLNDIDLKVQDLGILQDMDATQYNRYRDTMKDWRDDKNFAYGMYHDAVQQDNWQKTYDYNALWDKIIFDNDNSWKEKEWNANQSQLELENSRDDTETAENKMMTFVNLGEMPSDEMIAQAGWNKADVEKLVNAARVKLGLPPLGNNSSGNGYTGYTGTGGEGGGISSGPISVSTGDTTGQTGGGAYDNGGLTSSQVKQLQTKLGVTADGMWGSKSKSAAGGLSADAAWEKYFGDSGKRGSIVELDLGPVSGDLLVELANAGGIVGYEDGSYGWAAGWNKNNYRSKLEEYKAKPRFYSVDPIEAHFQNAL